MDSYEKIPMQADMADIPETPAERVRRIKAKALEGLDAPKDSPSSTDSTVSNKAAYVGWLKQKMLSTVGNGVSQNVMGRYMGKLRKKVKGK